MAMMQRLIQVTQLTADSLGGRKAYVSNGEDVKEDTKRGAIFVDSAELTRRGSGRLSASLEMMVPLFLLPELKKIDEGKRAKFPAVLCRFQIAV